MQFLWIWWSLISILWKCSLRKIPDLSKNSLKSHSFGDETTVSRVPSRDWRVSSSRCDCDKVFIRDRVASRCTCSRAYRIREIIMRAFISFDKRLCRLQFCAPFVNVMFREREKSTRLFQEKRICVVVLILVGMRINEWWALLMYRIPVDASRRDSGLVPTRRS